MQRKDLIELSHSLCTHKYVTLQFLCQILNSGRQIDGIPYESVGQPVLAPRIPGQNGPGMNADPVLERDFSFSFTFGIKFFQAFSHSDSRSQGVFRVIAILEGNPEYRFDFIPYILKHQALMLSD